MTIILQFFREYAAKYWRFYTAGLIALLCTNGLSVAIPWCLEQALVSVDPVTGDGNFERWVALILGAAIAVMVVRTTSRLLIFIPGREAEFVLRSEYFEHLLKQQAPFFRRMNTGDLLSRGSNDIQFVRVLIGFAGLQVLNLAFALPLNLAMMFHTSVPLTVGCVLPLLLALYVMRRSVAHMMTRMRRAQEELSLLSNEILESYNGVRVVQAYGANHALLERFSKRNRSYVGIQVELSLLRAFLLPIVTVVGNLAIVVLLWFGGREVASGELHFGVVSAYAVYVMNIVAALTSLGWVINVVQRGQISLSRIMEVLDADPGIPACTSILPDGPLDIELRDLTFSYPITGDSPALSHISLRVGSGQTLGVFGTTGSGKSTLVRLLSRLETPPPGTVFVGGIDVRDVSLRALRQAIAVVPQKSWLFSRTIRENIALSVSEDDPKGAVLSQAVQDAGLQDDLQSFPDGLDTVVGERGVTLSGGQRQRAALARAFYRGGRILILDDTLSAVDHDTEQRLIQAIYAQGDGRTVVMVSNRVSALRHADILVVLDQGRVVQQGTHDELLAAGGAYADAWNTAALGAIS
ncbi:MAG: ABC transporter ATP-binding protein [Myxococcota bacterium]|nr:ABC transporter ATP-binding protein [Myxococcota bacterium]